MATTNGATTNDNRSVDFEALIIGAGFGGLRMLYELNKRGVSAQVFEAGSNVGGTWYWNRYPGARTDTESWVYIMTFMEDLGMEWSWKERFPRQPEVEEYLNKVTDHLDLRKSIQFHTRIASAHHNDKKNIWKVTTAEGKEYTCTFLITATGPLATPIKPPFPGLDTFKGEWYQTGLWPKHEVDFVGKRVAVVGAGATAVQVIPVVAHSAKSLTVFQRTPNYVMPGRNHPVTKEQMAEITRNYEKHRQRARGQAFGMDFVDATRTMDDMKSDAEFQRVLNMGWESGGFRFIFETFADMLTNQKCNDAAAEFCRDKIRSIVRDEKTAELLCPHYTILSKRPPLGHHYYETFNRENVELVDVRSEAIVDVTEKGLMQGGKEWEFDLIIFAIGFDAITGTLAKIDLRNSQNTHLSTSLESHMATGYGITTPTFPNLFMISGPQAPFANLPVVVDNTCDWIGQTITHMRTHHLISIDTKPETAEDWKEMVNMVFNATVLPAGARETRSWYVGANVEGKNVEPMFYFGGVAPYFEKCKEEVDGGWRGFRFEQGEGGGFVGGMKRLRV